MPQTTTDIVEDNGSFGWSTWTTIVSLTNECTELLVFVHPLLDDAKKFANTLEGNRSEIHSMHQRLSKALGEFEYAKVELKKIDATQAAVRESSSRLRQAVDDFSFQGFVRFGLHNAYFSIGAALPEHL